MIIFLKNKKPTKWVCRFCEMRYHRGRYDAFASQIWCCSFHSQWCDVCLKMWRSHISFPKETLLAKRHHLPKANIIEKSTDKVDAFFWCRWPDSNRHGVATGGFWVHYVCQFHHTGKGAFLQQKILYTNPYQKSRVFIRFFYFVAAQRKNADFVRNQRFWWPVRESNSCYRRERAVS